MRTVSIARILVFILGLIAAPGRYSSAAEPDPYAAVHTVAIISQIGDTFTIRQIGTIAPSNSEKTAAIPDWKMNEVITSEIKKILSPRLSIRSTDAAIGVAQNIEDYILALPQDQKTDAYIIVGKNQVRDPGGEFASGLGMWRREPLFGGSTDLSVLYSLYLITVLDSKTGKIIGRGRGSLGEDSFWSFKPPIEVTREDVWADSPDALSEAQKTTIKEHLTQMIRISLPNALKRAGLLTSTAH